jgi:CBS domain containing-hemolysin-like protein
VSQRVEFEPTDDEEEGYDTIGGFVLGRLTRIPIVGDEVEVETGRFRVTQMSGRRIEYLVFTANR